MMRCLALFGFALICLTGFRAGAEEDGPAISITSPDKGLTFAFGSIKDHSLIWDNRNHQLVARVVFIDENQSGGTVNDDTLEFRLPGVTLDEAKGIFFATSAKGESIPVARFKKELFLKVIEILPNARVRIEHPRGNVSVALEAISPSDPAMHAPAPAPNPDGTRPVDIHSMLP